MTQSCFPPSLWSCRLQARCRASSSQTYQVGWQYLPPLEGAASQPGFYETASGPFGSTVSEPLTARKQAYLWQETVICELETVTHAWNQARRRALDRLTEEAVQAGADAVVSVELCRSEHDEANDTIDCAVSGTAVRWNASSESRWPLLTDLSSQDYWKLLDAGYEAVGLLATTVVIFVSPSRSVRLNRMRTTMQAQEIPELCEAFQAARDAVRARLRGQVDVHGGTGAVGIQLAHSAREKEIALEDPTMPRSTRGLTRGELGVPAYVTGKSDIERSGWAITMHGSGTAIRKRSEEPSYPPEKAMWMG